MSLKEKIRKSVKVYLGIDRLEERVGMIESQIYNEEALLKGFATLKPHLHPPGTKLYSKGKLIKVK